MKKLTKKREKEIRKWVEEGTANGVEGELLAEIDRLREEINLLTVLPTYWRDLQYD